MGKIIVKNAVERKPGFLYYIDGEGNLMETPMARGAKKKSKKAAPKKAKAKKK